MTILHMMDVRWHSGLAHYALMLSQGLQQKGHTVYFAALPNKKPLEEAQRLGLSICPYINLVQVFQLRRFIARRGIEVVNAHSGSAHALAWLATVGTRVPVIRTRSDARVVRPRLGNRFLYHRTPRVIAAAEYIRKDFQTLLDLSAEQVRTVYQGIDLKAWPAHPLPERPVLGIVARLDHVKGHRILLEALAIVQKKEPAVELEVVGSDQAYSAQDLKRWVDELGIRGVHLRGRQPDISEVMKGCRIGVIASLGSEAVSRVGMEWMASARPVVATAVGCLPELVEDGKTGFLIPPHDAQAMATALLKLILHPDHAQSMGAAGRRLMEQRFSMDQFVQNSEQVYREALAESGLRSLASRGGGD